METGKSVPQKCRIHGDVNITLTKDPVTGRITDVGCEFGKGKFHYCRYDNGPSMACCYMTDPSY